MSKVSTFNPATDEPDDYKEAVVKCIERIDILRQEMAEDDEEIDRLKSETKEIIERLKAA